jgi:hypothetical protein
MSPVTVTHRPLQFVDPLGHTVRQRLLQQTWWVTQACPHVPQCFGLAARLTH